MRRRRNQKMDVVFWHVPRQNFHIVPFAYAPNQLSCPFRNLSGQHRFSIFRNPYYMVLYVIYAMCWSSIFCHTNHLVISIPLGSLLSQQVDLKVSPEGEGFYPMLQTISGFWALPGRHPGQKRRTRGTKKENFSQNKKTIPWNRWNFKEFIGTPKGIRTPDSAVRGRRLDPLTMGAYDETKTLYHEFPLSFHQDSWFNERFLTATPYQSMRSLYHTFPRKKEKNYFFLHFSNHKQNTKDTHRIDFKFCLFHSGVFPIFSRKVSGRFLVCEF